VKKAKTGKLKKKDVSPNFLISDPITKASDLVAGYRTDQQIANLKKGESMSNKFVIRIDS
jgi:hypothetical protein